MCDIPEHLGTSPTFPTSLKTLWLYDNGIVELPPTFTQLTSLTALELGMNPMRSPPDEVWRRGIRAVGKYLRIRAERTNDIVGSLSRAGFSIIPDRLTPITSGILEHGQFFLSTDDVAKFDASVDAYINGKFYRGSGETTTADVVDAVVSQRSLRKDEMYVDLFVSIPHITHMYNARCDCESTSQAPTY